MPGERHAQRRRDRAVEDDDAAVGRYRVGGNRLRVRVLDRGGDGDPARVRVLDDHARRELELADEQARRGEVVQVVEGERLSVELLDTGEQVRPRAALRVVGGTLMRVLSVGELERLVERDRENVREGLAVRKPARDRRLVRGGRRERPRRECAPRLGGQLTPRPQLVEHRPVVLRSAHRRAVGEVLRRAAKERRPADVDHLDRIGLRDAVPRDRLLERIEVHADEVEGLDRVLLERAHVLRDVAPGEDPGVHARVKRLHPPAQHLRERR